MFLNWHGSGTKQIVLLDRCEQRPIGHVTWDHMSQDRNLPFLTRGSHPETHRIRECRSWNRSQWNFPADKMGSGIRSSSWAHYNYCIIAFSQWNKWQDINSPTEHIRQKRLHGSAFKWMTNATSHKEAKFCHFQFLRPECWSSKNWFALEIIAHKSIFAAPCRMSTPCFVGLLCHYKIMQRKEGNYQILLLKK